MRASSFASSFSTLCYILSLGTSKYTWANLTYKHMVYEFWIYAHNKIVCIYNVPWKWEQYCTSTLVNIMSWCSFTLFYLFAAVSIEKVQVLMLGFLSLSYVKMTIICMLSSLVCPLWVHSWLLSRVDVRFLIFCRFFYIDLTEVRKDAQCPICLGIVVVLLLWFFIVGCWLKYHFFLYLNIKVCI